MEKLLNLQEAADLTGMSGFTLRRWAKLGRVGVVRLSKRAIRFRQTDLETLVRTHLSPAREGSR
jgi:excisionase family DNA binding protein